MPADHPQRVRSRALAGSRAIPPQAPSAAAPDAAIARSLIRWFRATARDLPWRDRPLGAGRDPYRVLVSELMLQQTQASRVAERFDRFLERFPTVGALAAADEAEVLALWSGLGYYRRARLLHGAARAIVGEHAGRFPDRAATLAGLPGVGRYTAGAVASLSFLERTPAVDANVLRVILRLEGRGCRRTTRGRRPCAGPGPRLCTRRPPARGRPPRC